MIVEWAFVVIHEHRRKIIPLIAALAFVTSILFTHIFSDATHTEFDFLNVGQGDAELVQMKNGDQGSPVRLLIDGGPENGMVLTALSSLLPPTDTYIDLVAMTHAQADHMGGLIDIANQYRIGAFLWTGRVNDISAFRELMDILKKDGVKMITLQKGDVITSGYTVISVLSPDNALLHDKDLNESSLVLRVAVASTTALFAGDIGKSAERILVNNGVGHADIIKVPHHGSRASLFANFLDVIHPRIAIFEVGRNTYGHPTEDALSKYTELGATMFRTDKNGTIRVIVGEGHSVKIMKK